VHSGSFVHPLICPLLRKGLSIFDCDDAGQQNEDVKGNGMSKQKKILVTGAAGFVGRFVCQELRRQHMDFIGSARSPNRSDISHVAELSTTTNWAEVLDDIDAVIHLAARVHVMNEEVNAEIESYRDLNLYATMHLAQEAIKHGVRRFIFVSTIKVNGESSGEAVFSPEDVPEPHGSYSISKLEAEQALRALCQRSAMELVIVRPPLVYGPGVRANFLRLIQLVRLGVPLPLASVTAERSMIAVENLANFLVLLCVHPGVANRTWLISDGHDLRISDLIRLIASAMEKRARLFPVPVSVLKLLAQLTGKSDQLDRFVRPLRADISAAVNELGWRPVISCDQAIHNTVKHFLDTESTRK
jgi:UDP-glucose 4-epimerase